MKKSSTNKTRDLVRRYKDKYGIPDDIDITQEMVLLHWELEKDLTHQLRESNRENRHEVFDRCYSTLYHEIYWLNQFVDTRCQINPEKKYQLWLNGIGPLPQRIYEVGSGRGEMISYLASLGYECRATEITSERGGMQTLVQSNLTWANTDGVHLGLYESPDSFDIVLSADVVEHLHPDDLADHFSGAWQILKPGGKYILATPHKFFGPSDVSSLFDVSEPMGMHLKEYTVFEIVEALSKSGFKQITFPWPMFSSRYHKIFGSMTSDEVRWVSFIERVLLRLPKNLRTKLCQKRRVFPLRKIFLIANKKIL